MNSIAINSKPNQLYAQMQHAVGKCYSVDDCSAIATQADAIAAYFKQIKDDDSVKKFLAIKVRAWRKIGELLRVVDGSDCESKSAHIRKVRRHFAGDATVKAMSDTTIGHALKLSELPADFFEQAVGQNPNIYAILAAYQDMLRQDWEATPEGREALALRALQDERAEEARAEYNAAQAAKRDEENARLYSAKENLQQQLDQQFLDHEAMEAARKEVGFTMDRRDREHMKEVLFIIKAPIHEIMRQAAFDRHMTMQAVIRAGLAMWLIANGYPFDPNDMNLVPKPTPNTKKAA